MNHTAKPAYVFGLLLFIASFFAPSTADKMTSQFGEKVEIWCSPGNTQLRLALEPIAQVGEYFSVKYNPDEHGDGDEVFRRECIYRSLYFLPISCGWFSILLSVAIMPWTWIRPIKNKRSRLVLRVAGGVMLAAVPLLAHDFYHDATIYKGYFHLGHGAYLIVAGYLFIGTSFLLQFAGKQAAFDSKLNRK